MQGNLFVAGHGARGNIGRIGHDDVAAPVQFAQGESRIPAAKVNEGYAPLGSGNLSDVALRPRVGIGVEFNRVHARCGDLGREREGYRARTRAEVDHYRGARRTSSDRASRAA